MSAAVDKASSDPTMKSLWEILRRDRKLIAIIVCVFTLVAGAGAFFQVKEYRGTVQFAVETQDKSGGGGMATQFGALASLAGVSLGGESEKFEALALLQSRFLTEMFIQQNNLLPILFAKSWDAKAGRWISNDPKKIPTLWKADAEFKKIRTVIQDPKTELVTLNITWRDAELAAKWANALVALANKELREKAVHEADRHIIYLRDQATQTQLVPVQTALGELMESEYKQGMIAGGNEEYALKVIDPAFVPETPSSIRRGFIIIGGFFGGFFVACFFVFLRASWRGER